MKKEAIMTNFRTHHPSWAIGSIVNGVRQGFQPHYGQIPNPAYQPGKWNSLKIEVAGDQTVTVFLNGYNIGNFTAESTTRGYGGVLVHNGYDNVVQFRDFALYPQLAY